MVCTRPFRAASRWQAGEAAGSALWMNASTLAFFKTAKADLVSCDNRTPEWDLGTYPAYCPKGGLPSEGPTAARCLGSTAEAKRAVQVTV